MPNDKARENVALRLKAVQLAAMKAYLSTTGAIFGIMAVLHIWRAAAEWPHEMPGAGFLTLMAALIVIPAALALWAFLLLQKTPR